MIRSDFTWKYFKLIILNVIIFFLAQYFCYTTDIYFIFSIIEDKVIEHHPFSATRLQILDEKSSFWSKFWIFSSFLREN